MLGEMWHAHIVSALFMLHFLHKKKTASIDVLWNTTTWNVTLDVSSDACKQTVNKPSSPGSSMMPLLPAVFDLSWTCMPSQPPKQAGFAHRDNCLSLCHSRIHCHHLFPHWYMAAFKLLFFCFFYAPPLVLGARFTVEKYSIYFPPMLSWWVWNVCLGKILRGVWKNNRAVNTKGRPRLASLFQMWSRHRLLEQLQPSTVTQYTATTVPLPVHQLGSHWIYIDRLLHDFRIFWMRVNFVSVCQRPQSKLVPNAHLSHNHDDCGRLEEKKNQQCII